MVFLWKRALAAALVPLALTLGTLLPGAAHAAKSTDPCKASAKSAACKAAKAQAAKKSTAKATSKTTRKKSTAKASGKATAKKSASTKTALKKTASKKTASKKKAASRTPRTAHKSKARRASAAALPPPAASVRAEIEALRSSTAYVQDLETSTVLFAKNDNVVRPIASISKLMTALVVVDANQPMDQMLEITDDDVDTLKHTSSRLVVGTRLSRGDMLHLALMSSENRAAHALGRNYPGGLPAFVEAMNHKARALGMTSTHFIEPTGLSSQNVSSPRDLARLLRAASQRPLIHRYSTDDQYEVDVANRTQVFRNTNLLVRKPDWDIKVSKTGYINEAGECLVMLARINGRDVAMVLLDSQGKLSRIGDAVRLRRILQSDVAMAML
ncbi:D-alanyl-D-alanine endopeptidase [Bordetella petrii]|uniref:Probable D-alanyl-D-alanine carboxypeptidase n=1 Tax=Bordetella petrii (strain ATCC BAA-461 / DSM 12804 / CCUG 43448 / CIP 107267 / Se-1111R) TaxID=340100 RepID=A9HZ28_BORPD|nr:D-alanyl-D-alanine endopeptidase [Bordetella petrii]CAP43900.1 probable D-alanyl-D-alanine carboxypeptidase [Bordetella petrii]